MTDEEFEELVYGVSSSDELWEICQQPDLTEARYKLALERWHVELSVEMITAMGR